MALRTSLLFFLGSLGLLPFSQSAPYIGRPDSIQKPLQNKDNATTTTTTTTTFSLDPNSRPLTFNYSTPYPHDYNWIGLYHASGGGPVNESFVSPSLVWTYAGLPHGSAHLDVDSLSPGDYQAYFLAKGGYKWLAHPLNISLQPPPADLYFPVRHITLHNARQFEHYSARIGGLLLGRGDAAVVTFEKIDGPSWVRVGPADGVISGVPHCFSPRNSRVIVRATADNGSTAVIHLFIPVRRVFQHLVHDLRILTYNLWFGGTQVNHYHEKQLRFILESGADIVGLQESTSDHATRLGKALGWYHWQSSKSVGILSRYPIVQEYGEITRSGGVRISFNGNRPALVNRELNFWTTHLGFNPYGPYDFCRDNMTADQVLTHEAQSGRTPQIVETLDGIQGQLDNASSVPVILTGDFNAPSHLDWIEPLREKNCGVAEFPWPTSVLPNERGLIDSFREAHPNPVTDQGITWSPISPEEPQDRIDFIYHTDSLTVVDSKQVVAGTPKPIPHQRQNEWTSDHAAVLTHFRL